MATRNLRVAICAGIPSFDCADVYGDVFDSLSAVENKVCEKIRDSPLSMSTNCGKAFNFLTQHHVQAGEEERETKCR